MRPKLPPCTELIETMRLNTQGQILLLPLHLRRLKQSAQQLGFVYSQTTLLNALAPYLHRRYPQNQRLRLTLATNGALNLQCSPLSTTTQPVWVVLAPKPIQSPSRYLKHKTTQRQHWAAGEQWLQRHPQFFDVIYYDKEGWITEGGRSNIYIQQHQQWWTPPSCQLLLEGVQRSVLLQQNQAREKRISVQELLHAPRLRVSNALRGWLDARLYPIKEIF